MNSTGLDDEDFYTASYEGGGSAMTDFIADNPTTVLIILAVLVVIIIVMLFMYMSACSKAESLAKPLEEGLTATPTTSWGGSKNPLKLQNWNYWNEGMQAGPSEGMSNCPSVNTQGETVYKGCAGNDYSSLSKSPYRDYTDNVLKNVKEEYSDPQLQQYLFSGD